jgi:hypothetical protein
MADINFPGVGPTALPGHVTMVLPGAITAHSAPVTGVAGGSAIVGVAGEMTFMAAAPTDLPHDPNQGALPDLFIAPVAAAFLAVSTYYFLQREYRLHLVPKPGVRSPPMEEPITAAELARRMGVNGKRLRAVLRANRELTPGHALNEHYRIDRETEAAIRAHPDVQALPHLR